MLRHEFQPGKLIAGVFITIAGITYVGDAGGAWKTPWFAVIPLLVFGLALAALVALLTGAIRRHIKARRTATSTDGTPDGTAKRKKKQKKKKKKQATRATETTTATAATGPSRPPEIPN
ncbi:hypothetical protein [Streptomyces graminilatus]|uniref:hypothetical protein n=1 Tax=Streptomyces graminilatus TaxID=1464070 RepID=UPI000A57543E